MGETKASENDLPVCTALPTSSTVQAAQHCRGGFAFGVLKTAVVLMKLSEQVAPPLRDVHEEQSANQR